VVWRTSDMVECTLHPLRFAGEAEPSALPPLLYHSVNVAPLKTRGAIASPGDADRWRTWLSVHRGDRSEVWLPPLRVETIEPLTPACRASLCIFNDAIISLPTREFCWEIDCVASSSKNSIHKAALSTHSVRFRSSGILFTSEFKQVDQLELAAWKNRYTLATEPPSTRRFVPVIKEAASEAR
jgi:hypothetical protein